MNIIKDPGLFVFKGGSPLKWFKNVTVDLTNIQEKSAEALANDPDCTFLEWKDPAKAAEVAKRRAEKKATKVPENEVAKRMADGQRPAVKQEAPAGK